MSGDRHPGGRTCAATAVKLLAGLSLFGWLAAEIVTRMAA